MSTQMTGTDEPHDTHATDESPDATGETQGTESEAAQTDQDRPTSISKDDAFHLLQNARRRAVLRYVVEHDEQSTFRMRDLAEEVAAWEHDTTVRQLSSDERQRVYIALYQSHLPKLDDHCVIEYNQSRGVVEPTPLVAALEPFLENGLHNDDDRLSVEDAAGVDEDSSGLADAFSSLFSR